MAQEGLKENTSEWRKLRGLSNDELRKEIAFNREMAQKEGRRLEAFMSTLSQRERLILEARIADEAFRLFVATKLDYQVLVLTEGRDLTEEQISEVVHRVAEAEKLAY